MPLPEELEQTGLKAVDYFLETWNSRDPVRWADSLNFPHVRPAASGPVRVAETVDSYIAAVDFQRTIETGWDHSEWDYRTILQTSTDKIHAAGQWSRYDDKGEVILTTPIVYIITLVADHWGIQSRFGADYAGETEDTTELTSRGLNLVQDFVNQSNAGNHQACAELLNYPHFDVGIGNLSVTDSSDEFALYDGDLNIESLQAVQTGKHSINLALELTESNTDRSLSGVVHVNDRDNHLGIQAWSFMETSAPDASRNR